MTTHSDQVPKNKRRRPRRHTTSDQELQPYDYDLNQLREREREAWAQRAIGLLDKYASSGSHAILIMPALYRRHIQTPLLEHRIT